MKSRYIIGVLTALTVSYAHSETTEQMLKIIKGMPGVTITTGGGFGTLTARLETLMLACEKEMAAPTPVPPTQAVVDEVRSIFGLLKGAPAIKGGPQLGRVTTLEKSFNECVQKVAAAVSAVAVSAAAEALRKLEIARAAAELRAKVLAAALEKEKQKEAATKIQQAFRAQQRRKLAKERWEKAITAVIAQVRAEKATAAEKTAAEAAATKASEVAVAAARAEEEAIKKEVKTIIQTTELWLTSLAKSAQSSDDITWFTYTLGKRITEVQQQMKALQDLSTAVADQSTITEAIEKLRKIINEATLHYQQAALQQKTKQEAARRKAKEDTAALAERMAAEAAEATDAAKRARLAEDARKLEEAEKAVVDEIFAAYQAAKELVGQLPTEETTRKNPTAAEEAVASLMKKLASLISLSQPLAVGSSLTSATQKPRFEELNKEISTLTKTSDAEAKTLEQVISKAREDAVLLEELTRWVTIVSAKQTYTSSAELEAVIAAYQEAATPVFNRAAAIDRIKAQTAEIRKQFDAVILQLTQQAAALKEKESTALVPVSTAVAQKMTPAVSLAHVATTFLPTLVSEYSRLEPAKTAAALPLAKKAVLAITHLSEPVKAAFEAYDPTKPATTGVATMFVPATFTLEHPIADPTFLADIARAEALLGGMLVRELSKEKVSIDILNRGLTQAVMTTRAQEEALLKVQPALEAFVSSLRIEPGDGEPDFLSAVIPATSLAAIAAAPEVKALTLVLEKKPTAEELAKEADAAELAPLEDLAQNAEAAAKKEFKSASDVTAVIAAFNEQAGNFDAAAKNKRIKDRVTALKKRFDDAIEQLRQKQDAKQASDAAARAAEEAFERMDIPQLLAQAYEKASAGGMQDKEALAREVWALDAYLRQNGYPQHAMLSNDACKHLMSLVRDKQFEFWKEAKWGQELTSSSATSRSSKTIAELLKQALTKAVDKAAKDTLSGETWKLDLYIRRHVNPLHAVDTTCPS